MDKSLEKRETYEKVRLNRIEELNKKIKTDSPTEKFKNLNLLFEEYKSYRYDSAFAIAHRELALAKTIKNEEYIALSKCDIAFCLSSSGLFKEAIDIIKDVNVNANGNFSDQFKLCYYNICQKLWQELANFAQTEPYYTEYTNKSKSYIDSIKPYLSTSDAEWWEATGAQQTKNSQFEAAIGSFNTYLNNFPHADTHKKAMVAAELAWAYIHKDNKNQAIINFARSAIYDNESATREITALFFLAKLINERGDYERANRYAPQRPLDRLELGQKRHTRRQRAHHLDARPQPESVAQPPSRRRREQLRRQLPAHPPRHGHGRLSHQRTLATRKRHVLSIHVQPLLLCQVKPL